MDQTGPQTIRDNISPLVLVELVMKMVFIACFVRGSDGENRLNPPAHTPIGVPLADCCPTCLFMDCAFSLWMADGPCAHVSLITWSIQILGPTISSKKNPWPH